MHSNDGWISKDNMLVRTYMLGSFLEAVEFVNDIADIVESKDLEYPTITIERDKVRVAFYTPIKDHATRLIDELYDTSYSSIDEDDLLRYKEGKDKARLRSRGPYRKSSGAGLR